MKLLVDSSPVQAPTTGIDSVLTLSNHLIRQRVTQWTRRRFLRSSAAGLAAAGGLVSHATAAPGRRKNIGRRRTRTGQPLEPKDAALLKLINRITMGYTRDDYAVAESMGYDNYLESQLNYEDIDDSSMQNRLNLYGFLTLTMTSQQIYGAYQDDPAVPVGELIRAAWLRATYSKRQLHERMVAFWTDHFNIDITKDHCRWLKTADDRDVIRTHAMTSFPELLSASAHSPAMLFYLDNYYNQAGMAQENYAREVMELHSMGVDGGYTQADVEEVARCFTGWTITANPYGVYTFYMPWHDDRAKTVLGQKIPAGGGESDGQTVLDILSTHPSTARFIAKKLCTWFLGYNPPEDIIEAVKQTYLTSNPIGDIKSMLRVILHPTTLTYLSTPKVKRPVHLVTSFLRATRADVLQPRAFDLPIYLMGQLPLYWPTPDGYPDTAESWGTALKPRWDFMSNVIEPNNAVQIDFSGLLSGSDAASSNQQADTINEILTGGAFSNQEVSLIQQFYDDVGATEVAARESFGLAASLPGFQWY